MGVAHGIVGVTYMYVRTCDPTLQDGRERWERSLGVGVFKEDCLLTLPGPPLGGRSG